MENNPRAVFERLFGDSDTTDPAARLRTHARRTAACSTRSARRSPICRRSSVRATARSSREYLDAIRDVERRIQKAEAQSDTGAAGRRTAGRHRRRSFEEYAKLMFDLQVLAYQSDLTRVITFMIGHAS